MPDVPGLRGHERQWWFHRVNASRDPALKETITNTLARFAHTFEVTHDDEQTGMNLQSVEGELVSILLLMARVSAPNIEDSSESFDRSRDSRHEQSVLYFDSRDVAIDPLISSTTQPVEHLLSHAGYGALILLAFIESSCLPIPSEITFGFAGVLAATGKLNLALVIVIGSLAEILGSTIAYSIGRFGGRRFVERFGRYVLLTRADLDRSERWFSGTGEFAVLIGRAMPVLRLFVSVFAGIGEMPPAKFVLFSSIGTVIYIGTLSSLGYEVGSNWHRVIHDFSIAGYVIIGLVVALLAFGLFHRVRELRRESRA